MEVITFNIENLENKIREYESDGKDDLEIINELLYEGYTLDSFRYNESRYKWFKQAVDKFKLEIN